MEQNDFKYHVTMSLVRKMVKQGLLTADEYDVIDTKMREKYRPKIGTIFVKIPLTEPKKDGNMVADKQERRSAIWQKKRPKSRKLSLLSQVFQ